MIPLTADRGHAGVDQGGGVIVLVAHELHAAVLVAEDEGGLGRVGVAVLPVVPDNAHQPRAPGVGQALDAHL